MFRSVPHTKMRNVLKCNVTSLQVTRIQLRSVHNLTTDKVCQSPDSPPPHFSAVIRYTYITLAQAQASTNLHLHVCHGNTAP